MEYIGVDVGGTKFAAAVLRDGGLGPDIVRPTRTDSGQAILDDLVAVVERLRGPDTVAVGIGVPSIVEFATGRIRNSNNIPLADVALRDVLTERTGLPVHVDNDANCAALAEATGAAAEVGHMMIGTRSLEQLAAGTELDRLTRQLGIPGVVTGRDAVAAAAAGDARAIAVLRTLGARLGVGIANLINTFDPREVVIGGGVSAAGELVLEPARETARRHVFPGVGTACVIRAARAGVVAGLLGSALLAKTEHEGQRTPRIGMTSNAATPAKTAVARNNGV
jgi:glucokinase